MGFLETKFEIKNEMCPISLRGSAAYSNSSGVETKGVDLGHTLGDFASFPSVLFFFNRLNSSRLLFPILR